MYKRFTVALVLALLATPALTDVVIRRSGDRIFADRTEPSAAEKLVPSGFFERDAEKGAVSTIWVMPWVIDDSDPFGNSTFFSVRNDNFSGTDATVDITYYDDFFVYHAAEFATLSVNELVPYSVRAVGGLITAPGLINRGIVEIETNGDISTDVFQVDFDENFASGDRGFTAEDFCTNWRVRFLRFPGTTGGTVVTFLINGPLGRDELDPPTITGEVFSQSGEFINSFSVFTDRWILEIDALDLVSDDTEFGTLVLELDTLLAPRGVVLEKHSAFSKFSLGVLGICTDMPS